MNNDQESEQFLKAYAIERAAGGIYLQIFLVKDEAYKFIEEKFNDSWSNIQRKHKLKIVKIEVIKKKWR